MTRRECYLSCCILVPAYYVRDSLLTAAAWIPSAIGIEADLRPGGSAVSQSPGAKRIKRRQFALDNKCLYGYIRGLELTKGVNVLYPGLGRTVGKHKSRAYFSCLLHVIFLLPYSIDRSVRRVRSSRRMDGCVNAHAEGRKEGSWEEREGQLQLLLLLLFLSE